MTAEVLADAGYDDFEDVIDEGVKAAPAAQGPSPSRGGPRAGAGRPRGRPRGPGKAKLDSLQKRLSSEMFQAGAMVGFGLPVTGMYVCQESDAFTKAVVQLASHRAEWLEALEHLADIQPGIVIGRTVVGIGAAIAVDRERIPPERKFLQFLGVTSAWLKIQEHVNTPEEGNAYQPPPSKFVPVG